MKQILIVAALATASLRAQNSDLSFLFGASQTNASIRNGEVIGDTQGSMQINYAWQFKEGKAGRLYVELPLLLAGGSSGQVGRQVIGTAGATVFLTPGLRYHYSLSPRIAVYVAAGAGFASKAEERGAVSNGNSISTITARSGGAYNVGGGLDFRLTRLWSLRAEVRNFRTTQAASLLRRNTMVQFGFALHF